MSGVEKSRNEWRPLELPFRGSRNERASPISVIWNVHSCFELDFSSSVWSESIQDCTTLNGKNEPHPSGGYSGCVCLSVLQCPKMFDFLKLGQKFSSLETLRSLNLDRKWLRKFNKGIKEYKGTPKISQSISNCSWLTGWTLRSSRRASMPPKYSRKNVRK